MPKADETLRSVVDVSESDLIIPSLAGCLLWSLIPEWDSFSAKKRGKLVDKWLKQGRKLGGK